MGRGFMARLASLSVLVACVFGVGLPAQAVPPPFIPPPVPTCPTPWWPTAGAIITTPQSIRMNLQLTRPQLENLRCMGLLLEVTFPIQGVPVGTPYTWSSNLPSAEQDVPIGVRTVFTPGITMVRTFAMDAGTPYYIQLTWQVPGTTVTGYFAPAHHAYDSSVIERNCSPRYGAKCVFPTGPPHVMVNNVPLGGTYTPQ